MNRNNSGVAQIGTVTSVYADQGQVRLDIEMPRPGKTYRKVPFFQLAPGMMITPSENEQVAVLTLEDGSRLAMFPQGRAWTGEYDEDGSPIPRNMPTLGENELVFKFDDESEIRVQKAGDGFSVWIAGSGAVNIDAENDVNVTAGNTAIVTASGTDENGDPHESSARVQANGTVFVTADEGTVIDTPSVYLGTKWEDSDVDGEDRIEGTEYQRVARQGDAVRVWAPEHGWIDGYITGGSENVIST